MEMVKIIERIRKLLALARDKAASENEAATALAMAQRLMLEHDIKNVEDAVEVEAIRGGWVNVSRGDKWERVIASSVATMFNCRNVFRTDGAHQFVGKPDNIEVCEVTFIWVCEQVEQLYKVGLSAFRRRMGSLSKADRGDFRKTFKEACAMRIWQRVAEIVAAARNEIPAHRALVVIDQSLAAADELLNDVKKGRSLSLRRSGFGTGAGHAAGDQVKLQREVKK
jgi:Protein of unknown function (DUF2786)